MYYLIQILGVGASLMLLFLTGTKFHRKKNKVANRWLSVHLFCIFLLFLDDIFTHENIYFNSPHCYGFMPIATLLLMPSLYFTTISYTKPQRGWKKWDIFHFSLLGFYGISNLSFYLSDEHIKLQALKNDNYGSEELLNLIIPLFFIQAVVYGVLMIRILAKHKKVTNYYSAKGSDIQLNWLRDFIWILLFLLLFWFLELAMATEAISFAFSLVLLIGLFLLAHSSLQQKSIFPTRKREREEIIDLIEYKIKGVTANKGTPLLTDAEMKTLASKLNQIMETEKPYLDDNLNISRLAEQVETSAYQLSYLLNNHYKKNFSTYVNEIRVKEAMNLLTDPAMAHLNIIQIAYEAGFGSKTVFNTNFKRFVKLSPTLYRKQVQDGLTKS